MKTQFDQTVPQKLVEIQLWFGKLISRRLTDDDDIQPFAENGTSIETEATRYITTDPILQAHERLEIYNRCYWFRLLGILYKVFPLVVRLFSYTEFNQKLGVPYLDTFPPNTWDLNLLSEKFIEFIEKTYNEEDKDFVLDAAHLDWAYEQCMFSGKYPALDLHKIPLEKQAALLQTKLRLQPSLFLLDFPYDLLHFRKELKKEAIEYWEENPFPELLKEKKHYFFALWRNFNNKRTFKEIPEAEFQLLKLIKDGKTIEDACDTLEEKASNEVFHQAEENLSHWIQEWFRLGWLA